MTAHGAFESFDPWEEAGVVNAQHEVEFMCGLSGCERRMSAMVGKICAISLSGGEEVAMFGDVVQRVIVLGG
jgi:hypothetical protein